MAYLVKPFTKVGTRRLAIEMAVSRFTEIRALDWEVNTLRERLEVRKLLDRLGLLQSEHGMTEPQAFRWIQKTSMDRRWTTAQGCGGRDSRATWAGKAAAPARGRGGRDFASRVAEGTRDPLVPCPPSPGLTRFLLGPPGPLSSR